MDGHSDDVICILYPAILPANPRQFTATVTHVYSNVLRSPLTLTRRSKMFTLHKGQTSKHLGSNLRPSLILIVFIMVNVDMIYESLSACAARSTSADSDSESALLQPLHNGRRRLWAVGISGGTRGVVSQHFPEPSGRRSKEEAKTLSWVSPIHEVAG